MAAICKKCGRQFNPFDSLMANMKCTPETHFKSCTLEKIKELEEEERIASFDTCTTDETMMIGEDG